MLFGPRSETDIVDMECGSFIYEECPITGLCLLISAQARQATIRVGGDSGEMQVVCGEDATLGHLRSFATDQFVALTIHQTLFFYWPMLSSWSPRDIQ